MKRVDPRLLLSSIAGAVCSVPFVYCREARWFWMTAAWTGVPLGLGLLFRKGRPGRPVAWAVAFNVALSAALPFVERMLEPGWNGIADQPFDFMLWWHLRGAGAGILLAQCARITAGRRLLPRLRGG